jgi:predicted metal-dependent phosphotriesterase family hydrolase
MGKIQTVCGKIDSADLGVTTMHEHTIFKPAVLAKILMKSMPDMFKGIKGYENGSDIGMEMERRKQENITGIPTASISSVISSMKMPGTNPKRKLSDMDYYIQELLQFKRIGGTSLVDCSPLPFKGIRPETRRELSRRSGINIIAAAGYYTKCTIPKKDLKMGESWMMEKVVAGIRDGFGEEHILPGIVKCAVSCVQNGAICEEEMTAVRACANAAKKTGLCLHIHTAFPVRKTMILELADILSGQIELDPRRVVFCHMDSYNLGSGNPSARINKDGYDMELPVKLAEKGFNVGLDTWGSSNNPSEADLFNLNARKKMLQELIAAGYIQNITLGHDMMSKASGTQNGNQGYTLWLKTLKKMMNDGTITPQEFYILTIDNPAGILTIDRT